MKTVFHAADTRGKADHGWLQANHSFSFASYHNPQKVHFGVLRVLNDDIIAGGKGFGTHPHDNMEIITIPLEGAIEHKDSMGNSAIVPYGDIQVMSAGTGIAHSEFNPNLDQTLKLLQIWIFPNQHNVTPRYDQMTWDAGDNENKLQQILSPNADDAGVWIHQNAWIHLGKFETGKKVDYTLKMEGNGFYIFNLKGEIEIENQILSEKDAFGIWETNNISIAINSAAEFMIIEVPMDIDSL